MSALAGAIIGSMTSIITIIIQGRREDRRHQRDFAMRLALEDRKEAFERAPAGAAIMPSIVYLDYYVRLAKDLEKGPLTGAKIQALSARTSEISDAIEEADRARRER